MYNAFALISCFIYLVGSVVYDRMDSPESPADYHIYYIPLSLMIFALILKAKQGHINPLWNLFMWLSIGQLIKMCLFNPFLQTFNDYVYLACVVIFVAHQFVKNKK